MKKLLIVTAVLIGMMASAMMLSSFTTQKANSKTEISLKEMGDDWRVLRDNVAYCSGDGKTCEGTGTVYVNYENGQYAFSLGGPSKYDLTYYDGLPGYNYRFYYNGGYHYVYIN